MEKNVTNNTSLSKPEVSISTKFKVGEVVVTTQGTPVEVQSIKLRCFIDSHGVTSRDEKYTVKHITGSNNTSEYWVGGLLSVEGYEKQLKENLSELKNLVKGKQ